MTTLADVRFMAVTHDLMLYVKYIMANSSSHHTYYYNHNSNDSMGVDA